MNACRRKIRSWRGFWRRRSYRRQPAAGRRSHRSAAQAGLLCLGVLSVRPVFGQAGTSQATVEIAGVLLGAVLLASAGVVVALRVWQHNKRSYACLYRLTRPERAWSYILGRYRFSVYNDICRIGRHPGNEITITDKSISRLHAHLVRHPNGTFSIYDAGSTNGIKVGNRPVLSSFLKEGDFVDIGNVRFKFTRLPRDNKSYDQTQLLPVSQGRHMKRRRHEGRADFVSRVRLYNDDLGWINGWMRNAGRDGAYVETDTKLPSRLPLDIVVSVSEGTKHRWLHLSAEVVWSDPKGAGIRFMDVDTSSIDKLVSLSAPVETEPESTRSDERTVH